MAGKNRYVSRARISTAKFREMTQLFSKDISAVEISEHTGLNRNTVNRYIQALRKRIIEKSGKYQCISYPDASPLYFGVLVRNSIVYVEPIEKAYSKDVRSLIAGKSVSLEDENVQRWREYDGLISIERSLQIYLNFGKILRSQQPDNVAISEDFFLYVKERMGKFYGIAKKHFFTHLKECEFRYNHRTENLYVILLKMAKDKPLFAENQSERPVKKLPAAH